MVISLRPPLEGVAAQRFISFAKQIESRQRLSASANLEDLCLQELKWAKGNPQLNGDTTVYAAAARVLTDLARLSWTIHADQHGVELHSPPAFHRRQLSPEAVAKGKEAIRSELEFIRNQQFRQASVREFVTRLERPSSASRKHSITELIADGQELHSRLTAASSSEELGEAIQPYLQLVDPDKIDEFTGIGLGDVWRYFRYTWAIPYLPIPGRHLNYLIRDAAHPSHAIIGIAGLSNCAMQMKDRDDFIGWTFKRFAERIRSTADSADARLNLERVLHKLLLQIDFAVSQIDITGLATQEELASPTPALISRLKRTNSEFAQLRESALREMLSEYTDESVLQLDPTVELPPIEDDLLDLDFRKGSSESERQMRRSLIVKKRAYELYRLSLAKMRLLASAKDFVEPAKVATLLNREEFQATIGTVLTSIKSSRVGNNILEITTCGAVSPYNEILCGKLVALLMLSPEVADDYKQRYGSDAAIISSQLKNERVTRSSELVYIGTTSLFPVGASQYNRLKLPAGVIDKDQPELQYRPIGYTSGYGTVQFPVETMRSLDAAVEERLGFQNVNSVFGEGPSPKLRKLRTALELVGFPADALMKHNQQRLIYGVPLSYESIPFLNGEEVQLPSYITHPERFREASSSVVAFWRERWLLPRVSNQAIMDRLRSARHWTLSERLPSDDEAEARLPNHSAPAAPTNSLPGATDEIRFWRSLANSGPNVCSDELSEQELDWLHVTQALDQFLIDSIENRVSIVLTGNAGDGKTHLIRRLQSSLEAAGAVVIADATAAMKAGSIEPVLNTVTSAIADGRPFCLAANEYPLYLLRQAGKAELPVLQEVDRQCRQRLAYGPVDEASEAAQQQVLVVDLSLRNPLTASFVCGVLDRLHSNPALKAYAESEVDLNFTRNFLRLDHATVRQRLFAIFQRIVDRGNRCSLRELWIWLTRLLFVPEGTVALSHKGWYSDRIFDLEERFEISRLLRSLADPAQISHPAWDLRLERAGSTANSDWLDGEEPLVGIGLPLSHRFDTIKRAFFFEHVLGEEAFALEDADAKDFALLLHNALESTESVKKKLLEAINRCYCPSSTLPLSEGLFVWVGHRFHEQPTKCYVSDKLIGRSQIRLELPRLPQRIRNVIDYQPDHILLRCGTGPGSVALRIDFSLYSTLSKVRSGLPRHLLDEQAINRLDLFMDQLELLDWPREPETIVYNATRRSTIKVSRSSSGTKYQEVIAVE